MIEPQALRAQTFFLVYHGKGYTYDSVGGMTLDEMNDHSRLLAEQMRNEQEAHKEAIAKAKAQSRSGRRR